MKTKLLKALIIGTLLCGLVPAHAAGEPARVDAELCARLIKAIEVADHATFVADGESGFRKMTKEQFATVAAKLGPRFQAGYEIAYLGELRQRGYHVTLWKLSFKDGTDDALASLSTKDGKVGGFFIN
jgi:hypothetical protein